MTSGIRDQLQATLGSAYTLERELGGGGMSRVFVAEETALRRKVVVKVLPPELTAGVNVERFNREILVAAKLQHPHIVPVLSAGETHGLPYYTMPLVDGESLRARLARGPLAITETVGLMRDVAKALAFAHERGIVHRDIKPDNVLITGGSATVTDFGIAKAISASRTQGGNETLTQVGTSIGTPTYMSPEQAAGDPDTDHRTDIYSFGCMAYELLAGQPPFVEKTPRKLLAAHMGEKPRAVTELRPDTPSSLAELVMRCLEKEADDRPQAAGDLVRVLETVTSAGTSPAAPVILLGGPGMLKRALAIYAGAFVAVAILAKAAIIGIGLPDWVFPGSLIVMALGLPVILWTGYVQRVARRAMTMTPTYTPGGSPSTTAHGTIATMALKAAPHVSWYRTAKGGVYAFGGFIVLIAAFMTMRALGIGPFGSLIASGALKKDDQILLADFKSPATDTSLGPVVTEALRSELAKSKSIVLASASRVREVLLRMERPVGTPVDFATAREVATREGYKAIIDGEVLMLGNTRVVVARLVAAQTGEEFATFRETAKTDDEIVGAIDQLSRDLRERVGESLRAIQSTESMARVTTSSLAALKKFVQGDRLISQSDPVRGNALLEEAIALDTGFAMAYRRLAVSVGNEGGQTDRSYALMQKAFDHRERLSDEERLVTEGTYYWNYSPHQDYGKAAAAYEAALEISPDNYAATNNLCVIYNELRNFSKSELLCKKMVLLDSARNVGHTGLIRNLAAQGKFAQAMDAVARAERIFPRANIGYVVNGVLIAWAAGDADSAARLTERLSTLEARSPGQRVTRAWMQTQMALVRGKLRVAEQAIGAQDEARTQGGSASGSLIARLDRAFMLAWLRNDRAAAGREIDAATARTSLSSLSPADRPHVELVRAQAYAGRVDAAKATLADFERTRRDLHVHDDSTRRAQMVGDIALAEKRYDDAAAAYRSAAYSDLPWWLLPDAARAYDLGGHADSAIAVYARYVNDNQFDMLASNAIHLAPSLKRLGELYEAKGDRDNAIKQYTRFVDLWKGADPELQPQVAAVRDRLRKLTPVEKPR